MISLLKLFLTLSIAALSVAALAFWIWMLVDCLRRVAAGDNGKIVWLFVVLLVPVLGACIYFFFGRGPEPFSFIPPQQNVFRGFKDVYQPPPAATAGTPSPSPGTPNAAVNPSKCPRCGAALGPDMPEGLCPRCLLAMNLAATEPPFGSAAGTASNTPPLPPSEIARHFPQLEILECLGRGGMGVVYKARQPRLDRIVALKILAPERDKDLQFAARFTREAQALAKLSHPNIVTIHDFGEADGLYYLIMEYVDGVTLRGLMHGGKLAPEQALAIVPDICDALQFAHEHGIVHRDIKPENILLDKQGRVKIADFGIAKLMGADGASAFTRERHAIGTPYYMAPEQVEQPTQVDHRADIFSLGVVFYEMLTGELPMGRFALPSQKVQVDVRLDEIVLRALEKEPQRRYQQARQVKTAVETLAGAATGIGAAAGAAPESSFASSPPPPALPLGAQSPSVSTQATPASLSRTALLGAFWIPLCILAFCGSFFGVFVAHGLVLFVLPVAMLSIASPLGITICGWLAISQIRHSAGRLYGLRLAIAESLLFPLLLLDAVIVAVSLGVRANFVHHPFSGPVVVASILLCAFIDLLIALLVWRLAKKPIPSTMPSPSTTSTPTTFAPPPSSGTGRAILIVFSVLFCTGLLFVGLIIVTLAIPALGKARAKALSLGTRQLQTQASGNNNPVSISADDNGFKLTAKSPTDNSAVTMSATADGFNLSAKSPSDNSAVTMSANADGFNLFTQSPDGNTTMSTPVTPPASTGSGDFATRLRAANAISSQSAQDNALAELARDAANSGEAFTAKTALSKISSNSVQDTAARDVARLLAKRGNRTDAIAIAESYINSASTRDATLAELSK